MLKVWKYILRVKRYPYIQNFQEHLIITLNRLRESKSNQMNIRERKNEEQNQREKEEKDLLPQMKDTLNKGVEIRNIADLLQRENNQIKFQ